jgi:tetratricopeptide (TPR) repeat protein
MFTHMDRTKEAYWDFEEIWRRYNESTDPVIRRTVAAALLEAGELAEEFGSKVDAEKWYELTAGYADDDDQSIQVNVVNALSNCCEIYIDRGWMDPAVEKITALMQRWHDHPAYRIRRRLANLLVRKAEGLMNDEERRTEAQTACDEAIAYADAAVTPPAYFIQASAWLIRCGTLQRLERFSDGIACVDAMEQWIISGIHRLPDYEEDANRMVERSLNSAYLIKSTCLAELERYQEALDAFDKSGTGLDDIVNDPKQTILTLEVLTARAKLLCLVNRTKEAEAFYEAVQERVLSFGLPPVEILTTMATMGVMINLTSPADGSPDPS